MAITTKLLFFGILTTKLLPVLELQSAAFVSTIQNTSGK